MKKSASLRSLSISKSLLQKKVVRDFLAVVGSEIALRPVQFLKEFFVTKYLGPADYGLLKTIEMVEMLNKYGSLGFKPAAAREIGDAIGKNDEQKANLVRNTAYTAEFLLSLLLFTAALIFSLFFESKQISVLIILASAGLFAAKVRAIFRSEER